MQRIKKIRDRLFQAKVVKHWHRQSVLTEHVKLAELRVVRSRANQIRQFLDRVNHVATARLTLPLIGTQAFRKVPNSDYSYRPQAWSGPLSSSGTACITNDTKLGHELALFHDSRKSELTLRQIRNSSESDLAPFSVSIEVYRFGGKFLSLALQIPEQSLVNLKPNHILRMDISLESEADFKMKTRMNIRHGPNTAQIYQDVDTRYRENSVEFDLMQTNFKGKRAEAMWVDLFFEDFSMNQIIIRDLTFQRHPRAEI